MVEVKNGLCFFVYYYGGVCVSEGGVSHDFQHIPKQVPNAGPSLTQSSLENEVLGPAVPEPGVNPDSSIY